MMTPRLLVALALAVVVSTPTPATARNPTGRRISGIVQKTNHQVREAEILLTDRVGTLSFVWNTRTEFVANMQLVNSTILKQGAKVEVRYHRPLFGRPFVSRVTLLSASNRVP